MWLGLNTGKQSQINGNQPMGFTGGSVLKNLPAKTGSIPGSGRNLGGGNGNPLQRSCLENPRDGGAWWAAVYGVAQSRPRLKRLSSSGSRHSCRGKSRRQRRPQSLHSRSRTWLHGWTQRTIDLSNDESEMTRNVGFYSSWKLNYKIYFRAKAQYATRALAAKILRKGCYTDKTQVGYHPISAGKITVSIFLVIEIASKIKLANTFQCQA